METLRAQSWTRSASAARRSRPNWTSETTTHRRCRRSPSRSWARRRPRPARSLSRRSSTFPWSRRARRCRRRREQRPSPPRSMPWSRLFHVASALQSTSIRCSCAPSSLVESRPSVVSVKIARRTRAPRGTRPAPSPTRSVKRSSPCSHRLRARRGRRARCRAGDSRVFPRRCRCRRRCRPHPSTSRGRSLDPDGNARLPCARGRFDVRERRRPADSCSRGRSSDRGRLKFGDRSRRERVELDLAAQRSDADQLHPAVAACGVMLVVGQDLEDVATERRGRHATAVRRNVAAQTQEDLRKRFDQLAVDARAIVVAGPIRCRAARAVAERSVAQQLVRRHDGRHVRVCGENALRPGDRVVRWAPLESQMQVGDVAARNRWAVLSPSSVAAIDESAANASA